MLRDIAIYFVSDNLIFKLPDMTSERDFCFNETTGKLICNSFDVSQ